MPIYPPRLSSQEADILTKTILTLRSALQWDDPIVQSALQNREDDMHDEVCYAYGYMEAHQDLSLNNPLHNTFELTNIAAHDPHRAQGYADGLRDARKILAALAPKGKKKFFPTNNQTDILGLLRK